MIHKITLFVLIIALGGCAYYNRHLTKEGNEVYVYDKKPKECENLGMVEVSSMPEEVDVVNYLRNVAAEKGGTGIRVKKLAKYYVGSSFAGYFGEAYVYKCHHGSTSADIVGFIF